MSSTVRSGSSNGISCWGGALAAEPHLEALTKALGASDQAAAHEAIIAVQWLPLPLEKKIPEENVLERFTGGDELSQFMAAVILGDVGADLDEAAASTLVSRAKKVSHDDKPVAAYTKLLLRTVKRDSAKVMSALSTMSGDDLRKKSGLLRIAAACAAPDAFGPWLAAHALHHCALHKQSASSAGPHAALTDPDRATPTSRSAV